MFFALPEFSTKNGKIVNAVFGMAKFFTGQLRKESPDYIIFIKDARWKNFRHELFAEYKATRDKMPENLKVQIADIEKMIELMNVEIIAIPWYEADDVIATLATQYDGNEDYEVDILTWDKDLYALVSDNVKIYDTMKRKKFGPFETREKFWVWPEHVCDYLAINWDSSDNIPGVAGFGPGKVVPLLNVIGWIEKIYEVVEKLENGAKIEELFPDVNEEYQKWFFGCFKWKTYEKLVAWKENAFLSKKLATLELKVELESFDLETFAFKSEEIMWEKVTDFFQENEFFSLVEEKEKELTTWQDTWLQVQIVWDDLGLDDLQKEIENFEKIVLDTETSSLQIVEAKLIWVSIYLDDSKIYYINRLHHWPKVSDECLKKFIQTLLEKDLLIIGHNLKYDLEILDLYLTSLEEIDNSPSSESQMSFWM